jgi:hypothetical protein
MTLTLVLSPIDVSRLLACAWCDAMPGEPHVAECPERGDGADFPARCGRCGVSYLTTCACEEE